MFTWIFGSILVPTWLHFGSQNPPKSSQKSIPRGINFLIDFYIDFLSIFARFWRPTWGHVGHIFAQNGGALWHAPLLSVESMLSFEFLAVLTPSWPHVGSLLAPLGPTWPRFRRFLAPFWHRFGAMLGPLGARRWSLAGWCDFA